MRYEFIKPREYHEARDRSPIAYIPWGAHEWHGFHDPLGLDTLKAHGLCLALCAETGGVVFPQVYCGTQTMKPYAGFDCTLDFSRDCVKMLAAEHLRQLCDEGFRVIVIIMGHYGPNHVETIREAVYEFNQGQDACTAWAFPDYEMTRAAGIEGDHAGATETSYMLYFHPELVDLSRLATEGEPNMQDDGVGGLDPRIHASARLGLEATNLVVRNAAHKILALMKQTEE